MNSKNLKMAYYLQYVLTYSLLFYCLGKECAMEGTYGILSLLPVFVVIVTAIITKRAVEPLSLYGGVGGDSSTGRCHSAASRLRSAGQ